MIMVQGHEIFAMFWMAFILYSGLVMGSYIKMKHIYQVKKGLGITVILPFLLFFVHLRQAIRHVTTDFRYTVYLVKFGIVSYPICVGIFASLFQKTEHLSSTLAFYQQGLEQRIILVREN